MVYYNTEPLSDPTLYTGSEGGRFGADEEVEDCLQSLAVAGKGRFHHFRVSGSFEGDDVLALMEEIDQAIWYLEEGRRILNDYRDFCRRVRTSMLIARTAEHSCVHSVYCHRSLPLKIVEIFLLF